MLNLKNLEVWFITGSQHLYGSETLKRVAANSREIAKTLDASLAIPVRLVFDSTPGPALNASMLDMGNRFRLLVNEVEVVPAPKPLPKLPVARALWAPKPSLEIAAAAWIVAGGAHHTGFGQAVTTEMLEDFAAIAGIEIAIIDAKTNLRDFQQQLRNNEVYYALNNGWTI